MDAAEIILDTRIRLIEAKITIADRGFTRDGAPSSNKQPVFSRDCLSVRMRATRMSS
jgi:hypothetical protein